MAPRNKRSRQSFFFLTKSTSVLITSFSATPMGDISRPGIYRDSAVCNKILYPFSIYSPTVLVRNCSCFWLDLYEMAPRKKSSQKNSSFQQKNPLWQLQSFMCLTWVITPDLGYTALLIFAIRYYTPSAFIFLLCWLVIVHVF